MEWRMNTLRPYVHHGYTPHALAHTEALHTLQSARCAALKEAVQAAEEEQKKYKVG